VAAGKAETKRSYSSAGKASPDSTQNFSAGSRSPMSGTPSSSARSSDGTSHRRETCPCASASTSAGGSRTTSSARMAVGTPCSSPPNSSQMLSTKFSAVRCPATSPACHGYSAHIHCSRFSICRSGTTTPFGCPVEPEV